MSLGTDVEFLTKSAGSMLFGATVLFLFKSPDGLANGFNLSGLDPWFEAVSDAFCILILTVPLLTTPSS